MPQLKKRFFQLFFDMSTKFCCVLNNKLILSLPAKNLILLVCLWKDILTLRTFVKHLRNNMSVSKIVFFTNKMSSFFCFYLQSFDQNWLSYNFITNTRNVYVKQKLSLFVLNTTNYPRLVILLSNFFLSI